MEISYAPDTFRAAVKIATQTVFKNTVGPADGHLLFLVDNRQRVALASVRSAIAFLSKPSEFSWDTATQMCIKITDIVETISEMALKHNTDVKVEINDETIKLSTYSIATSSLSAECPVLYLDFNTIYMFKGMVQGKVRDATCSNPYLGLKALKLLSTLPRRRDADKDKDAIHIANVPGHADMFIITPDWMNGLIFLAGCATREWNSDKPPMLVGEPI